MTEIKIVLLSDKTWTLVYFIAECCPQSSILQIGHCSHRMHHHLRYCHRHTWKFHNWIRLVGDHFTNIVRQCSPRLFCFVIVVWAKHYSKNLSGKLLTSVFIYLNFHGTQCLPSNRKYSSYIYFLWVGGIIDRMVAIGKVYCWIRLLLKSSPYFGRECSKTSS